MAQNSSESTNNSSLEAVVGSQSLENAQAVVAKALSNVQQAVPTMKQSSNPTSDVISSEPAPNPPEKQNGSANARSEVVDLTGPVKTKGEPSSMTVPMADTGSSGHPSLGSRDGLAPTPTSTESMGIAAFGNQMAGLGAQLQLTAEEQAAAYKKANVLALTALAKKGGPNAKEMLAVQQKLQEFLTSLIALAGQKGPDLKVKVQLLVQHLVTGQISEEDFATRIEADLHSQHQPSLLPFLKNSVPPLKTRLQLQQAIMKELLQRQAAEKQQQKNLAAAAKQLQNAPLTQAPPPVKITSASLPATTNSSSPAPLSLPLTVQGKVAVSKSQNVSSVLPNVSNAQAVTLQLQKQAKSTNANDPIIIPATSNTAAPIVLGPVGGGPLPPAIQQQLATALNSPAMQQQFFNQLPKNIRDQVAKLPVEQQKFVYAHHVRRLQHLKAQAQQNGAGPAGAGDGKQGASVVASSFPTSSTSTAGMVASPQVVLEKQQQLVKQQQGAFVLGGGGGGAGKATFGASGKSTTGGTSVTATSANVVGKSVQMLGSGGGKPSFVNMKVAAPSGSGQAGATASSSPSKKERGKGAKHKDGAAGEDEEDEVVGMDILDEVGVNLQEETAHFLPRSVGETTQRLYKDEVFLNGTQLKQRVLPIARRYGLSDVSDEFLVLLSHATQERLKGVVEKLTQISQHRISVLKDNDKYAVSSETRSQLRVLETIDRVVSKRKQERENEQTLRAAKSRSKGTDPEKVAKLREEAKQIQQDKANVLLNAAANQTALAAIGQRKRPLSDVGGASGSSQAGSSGDGSSSAASLFASLTTTRAPKRHITSRDLIFYMEQERETRKSLTLYRTLLK